ncbi:hypothetical protein Emag_003495 [Eimeria magna]
MGAYLSSPLSAKETAAGACSAMDLRWGVCSMQGWRVSMEDAHLVLYAKRIGAAAAAPGTKTHHAGQHSHPQQQLQQQQQQQQQHEEGGDGPAGHGKRPSVGSGGPHLLSQLVLNLAGGGASHKALFEGYRFLPVDCEQPLSPGHDPSAAAAAADDDGGPELLAEGGAPSTEAPEAEGEGAAAPANRKGSKITKTVLRQFSRRRRAPAAPAAAAAPAATAAAAAPHEQEAEGESTGAGAQGPQGMGAPCDAAAVAAAISSSKGAVQTQASQQADLCIFAVFDGHGGAHVSRLLSAAVSDAPVGAAAVTYAAANPAVVAAAAAAGVFAAAAVHADLVTIKLRKFAAAHLQALLDVQPAFHRGEFAAALRTAYLQIDDLLRQEVAQDELLYLTTHTPHQLLLHKQMQHQQQQQQQQQHEHHHHHHHDHLQQQDADGGNALPQHKGLRSTLTTIGQHFGVRSQQQQQQQQHPRGTASSSGSGSGSGEKLLAKAASARGGDDDSAPLAQQQQQQQQQHAKEEPSSAAAAAPAAEAAAGDSSSSSSSKWGGDSTASRSLGLQPRGSSSLAAAADSHAASAAAAAAPAAVAASDASAVLGEEEGDDMGGPLSDDLVSPRKNKRGSLGGLMEAVSKSFGLGRFFSRNNPGSATTTRSLANTAGCTALTVCVTVR